MMKQKIIILSVLIILLAGCTLLSPIKHPLDKKYLIDQTPKIKHYHSHHVDNLIVMFPETFVPYHTTQIAYSLRNHEINYYTINHWIATPSQMIHPLLVETLQKMNYFQAVIIPPYVGKYHYTLFTRINQFMINFKTQPISFDIKIMVTLKDNHTNKIIKSKNILVREPIYFYTPYNAVKAANRATAKAIAKITYFSIK